MKEYYVEVFNPPFPNKAHKVRVFTKFVQDALSPNLIALFRVKAEDKQQALALVMLGRAFTMISPSGQQLGYNLLALEQAAK